MTLKNKHKHTKSPQSMQNVFDIFWKHTKLYLGQRNRYRRIWSNLTKNVHQNTKPNIILKTEKWEIVHIEPRIK
jgi:hypothetical protein